MLKIAKLFTVLSALIHVSFFFIESIFWQNPNVYHNFGLNENESNITSLFAFNQGFYNLFLAIGCITGLILLQQGKKNIGFTLIVFTLFSMLGASIVLLGSNSKLIAGAITQGLPPLFALMSFYSSSNKT